MQQGRSSELIAWDVDDVLNDLTSVWANWAGLELSTKEPATGEVSTWLARQGIGRDSYLDSLDEFRVLHYQALAPNPSILELLAECDLSGSTHIALTATPMIAQAIVAEWTMRHFGEWFSGVWFSPSRRKSDPPGLPYPTKGDALRVFRGSATLIDDSEVNLATMAPTCTAIIFPQPWNSGCEEVFDEFVARLSLKDSKTERSVT